MNNRFLSILVTFARQLICLLFSLGIAHADVVATVSHTSVTTEQTLELKVTASGAAVGRTMDADFTGLDRDFEILGRSNSSNTVASGGQIEQTQVWSMELLPRKQGELVIPSFTVNGEKTQPIKVTVTAPRVVPPGGDIGDFHVETTVDTEQPWVQSQVILTIKVYYAKPLLEGSLSSPETDGVVVRSLGEDSQYREIRGGKQYSVLERKMALFPQRSGEIVLSPIQLNAAISADPTRVQGFFSPRRQIRRKSNSTVLSVQPRPEGGAGWWLPASSVTVDGRWDGDVNQLRVGESITRSLSIQADGVDATQLPAIVQPSSDRFRIYSDQPELDSQPMSDKLRARRLEKWAIVPRESGELTLPEVRVPWFNTSTGSAEVAVLPSATINVLPAVTSPSQPPVAEVDATLQPQPLPPAPTRAETTPDSEPKSGVESSAVRLSNDSEMLGNGQAIDRLSAHLGFWRVAALAALAAWLLTLAVCAWLWLRHRERAGKELAELAEKTRSGQHQRSLIKAVAKACDDGNASTVAKSILQWASAYFDQHPPRTVIGLAQRVDDSELKHQLQTLDASLYSSSSPVPELRRLPELLRRYIDSKVEVKPADAGKILPEL